MRTRPYLVPLVFYALSNALLGCGSSVGVDPPDGGSERPMPTGATATCNEGGDLVGLHPLEVVDNRTRLDTAGPLYAAFSECPSSAAVRVPPYPATAGVVIPFDRPRSVLSYGRGYLPTRGPNLALDRIPPGLGISVELNALREDVWRPRLPRYRNDAPTVVVLIGLMDIGATAGESCRGEGTAVRVDDGGAVTSYLGAGPTYAASSGGTASTSGIAVIDGLKAGSAPTLMVSPPPGCAVRESMTLAPLENGVVSLAYVILAPL